MTMKSASTKTDSSFPFQLNWSPQDITDAVPLRLFELVSFDADTASNSPMVESRERTTRSFLPTNDLPAFIRVR
jgi:hypothetical protein